MSELIVFVFRDQYRAPEVLNELRRRAWHWIQDLDDAVAVTLNEQGRATVHLTVDLSRTKAIDWTRIWGSLLSTTLFLPLTDVMVEAANGITVQPKTKNGSGVGAPLKADYWREHWQLSHDFTRDVAALIRPGCSAIFMVLSSAPVPSALEQLRNYGDTLVHTPVATTQSDTMFAVLAQRGKS